MEEEKIIMHFLELDKVFYWILMFENLICMFPYFTLMYVIIFKEKKACSSTGIINIQLCIISILQSISFSFAVIDNRTYEKNVTKEVVELLKMRKEAIETVEK